MRILFLTTHLDIGGITSYISIVAAGLRAHGHQVWVASSGGAMAESLRLQDVHVLELPFRTKSELHPKLLYCAHRLRRLIRAHRIDVMHAQTRVAQVVAQRLSRNGPPFVSTWHGFFRPNLGRRLWPCMGEMVIAISPPVEKHLRRAFHVPPERIALIEHAIPVDQFQSPSPERVRALRQEFGFPDEAFVVGTVARLVPDKGVDQLVAAVAALRPHAPQVRCLVVGSGPEEERLRHLARQLNVQEHVVFLGSQTELLSLLSVMNCFVLPVQGREGFGLVLLEAMAMELPVIATSKPALRYVLDDGRAGILVPPRNVPALAHAIRCIIDDPARAEQLALRGYARVQEAFSLDRMLHQLEDVYTKVIREHHAATPAR